MEVLNKTLDRIKILSNNLPSSLSSSQPLPLNPGPLPAAGSVPSASDGNPGNEISPTQSPRTSFVLPGKLEEGVELRTFLMNRYKGANKQSDTVVPNVTVTVCHCLSLFLSMTTCFSNVFQHVFGIFPEFSCNGTQRRKSVFLAGCGELQANHKRGEITEKSHRNLQ